MSSSHSYRMLHVNFGPLADTCFLYLVLVVTFSIAVTTPAVGADVGFPSSPLGPVHTSSINRRQVQVDFFNLVACRDRRRECLQWAQQGECRKNIDFMAPHCERSCGYCDNYDPQCKNNNDKCVGWSIRGHCQFNPDYMKAECAAACKKCGTTTLAASLHRFQANPPGSFEVGPPSSSSK